MSNTCSKEFIEVLICNAMNCKKEIELLDTTPLTINDEDIKVIINECDYLIAGLYGLINPKNEEYQFDKKMTDVEFLNYAKKYLSSLDEDLKDIEYSKIFAG